MALADRLAALKSEPRRTTCSVCVQLARMSAEDRKSVTAVMMARKPNGAWEYSIDKLHVVFGDEYPVGLNQIGVHRRKCER